MIVWALINSVSLGTIYVMITLGLALILGVLLIPDFSQAGLYVFGSYIVYTMMKSVRAPFLVSLLVALVFVIAMALLMENYLYKPIQKKSSDALMVVAIGLLYILDNAALMIWGHEPHSITIPAIANKEMVIGNISIGYLRVITVIVAAVLSFAVYVFLMKTKTGDAIRAIMQNREGAILMGIRIGRIRSITFAMSAIMVTIAGAMIGSLFNIYPNMGDYIIVKGFGAVIIGGMGNILGAVIGALILGTAESFGATYISPVYRDVFSFIIIVLVLIFRPGGLFNRKERIG